LQAGCWFLGRAAACEKSQKASNMREMCWTNVPW
jgi:hypothetical protein